MSLSSLQLDAFLEISRRRSFSLAAQKLHLTQSAISQRILNLEEELGCSLFIREGAQTRLTSIGLRLLHYCQAKEALEQEFLTTLRASSEQLLAGAVRIAGFSTVVRSLIMPALQPLLVANPNVTAEIMTRELRDLKEMLERNETDVIFHPQGISKQGFENHFLGYEHNVMVTSKQNHCPEDIYLDHDEEDSTTFDFFNHQDGFEKTWKRMFLDEIYTIIDGVILGLGCAVVPRHIARRYSQLSIIESYKPFKTPLYVIYRQQSYYTPLQKQVLLLLTTKIKEYLASP